MLKSLFDVFLKGLTARWATGGLCVRLGMVGALVLVFFAVTRLGGLGAGARRLSLTIVPYPLPVLDAATPTGHVLVRTQIAGAGGNWTELIPGDKCPSGSRLRVTLEATEPGWIAAFGLAASGRYSLFEAGPGPIRIEQDGPLVGGVELDNELGVEVFGVLYSPHRLAAAEIEALSLDHAAAVATMGAGKGGNLMTAFAPLPDLVIGQTLFCRHTD
jgi:hypothetical protein